VTVFCLVLTVGSFVLVGDPNPTPYSQDEAQKYLYLAAAAYCNDTAISTWNCTPCQLVSGFQVLSILVNASTNTFGYIGMNSTVFPPQIVVVFRGTELDDLENWITDLHFAHFVDYRNVSDASVHSGFYEAYESVSEQILGNLTALFSIYPNAELVLVGHSLGAALATLAATDLYFTLNYAPNTYVWTYGCPRVGNIGYANLFDEVTYSTWRLTHWEDVVPHLPPMWLGFFHNIQEVWYNSASSSYKVCSLFGEDLTCSDSVAYWATSIEDHLHYLNYTIDTQNCNGSGTFIDA